MISAIRDAAKNSKFRPEDIGCPEIKHFMYKSKTTAQFITSEMTAPYSENPEAERWLHNLYLLAQSKTHQAGRNARFFYFAGENESLGAWVCLF